MFENELTSKGIHYTRYIASWKREGGKIFRGGLFERWLREACGLNDHEVSKILLLAENGKMELEYSARKFMSENKENFEYENEMIKYGKGIIEEYTGTHFHLLKKDYEQFCKKP